MTVPFSTADFSRISPTVHLQISAIIHQAVVEVSEKGTKAAASTAVETKATSAPMDPEDKVVFHANHPFIYLIRDNSTGSILFIGQMCKP
jgi:serpin B